MKLIIPFTYMDQFHYARYKDQFDAYSKNFNKVTIAVQFGVYPENDIKNLEFKIYNEVKELRKLSFASKIKTLIKKITFYDWIKKIELQEKLVRYFINEGIEGDALLSYSGTGINQLGGCELADQLGIPSIYRMRGNGVKERAIYAKPPNRFLSNRFHYRSLERYAAFIPICWQYYWQLEIWGVDKSKIFEPVGLGVDTEMFKPKAKPTNWLTLGYFGRISKEKNLKLLGDIVDFSPSVEFILVGKGGNKYKFAPNVRYVGYVRKEKMPIYYNMVHAVINPSLSEGQSNVTLEAYASGTPLIGTDQAFGDMPVYGYMMPSDNWGRWVTLIKTLGFDALERHGQEARKYALQNTWQMFGENMSQAIKEVVKNE